jgi:hypothetical protein
MELFEIKGKRGLKNPQTTTVLCATTSGNAVWYVVKGGTIVNLTFDDVNNGVDVETLKDMDCFTWDKPINTLKQLQKAIQA